MNDWRKTLFRGLYQLGLSVLLISGCEEIPVFEENVSNPSGMIQGTVTEVITGDPTPNVTIRLTGIDMTTETDENGLYVFDNLPTGDDTLCVESDRYEKVMKPTTLSDSGEISVDFNLIPYYPVTDTAPALEFLWGVLPDDTLDIRNQIYIASPFAYDEQGTLSQEMAIIFTHRVRDPVYALCSGVVTHWKKWSVFEDAVEPDKGGEVWIRYGKNFTLGVRHVVTVHPDTQEPLNWQVGQRVEKGDILAYTADWNGLKGSSFYEFVFAKKDNDQYSYLKGFDFFTPISEQKLLRIWDASQIKDESFGYSLVQSPWGDIHSFNSEAGDQEIPNKGRL